MSTARSVLRGLLANEIQSCRYTSLATTSDGNANKLTLVSTDLINLPGGGDTDYFVGMYVIITELVAGGPAIGESQRVSAYAYATGTITVESVFSAQVKSGTSFEVHRYDPTDLNTSLDRAVQLLYPDLHVPYRNETLVVDNLLANASLDTFSTTFTSWANIGTPTLAAETTRKVHGSGSASIIASGAVEGIEQNLFTAINFREVVGKTLHVRGWVFASAASSARLRVTLDGSTYTNGAYHGGDAEWEGDDAQTIDVVITADATEITVSCEVADGATAYFDLIRAWIDPVYKYTIPSAILKGPYTLSLARHWDVPDGPYDVISDYHVEEDSSGRYIILHNALTSGQSMKITGVGLLSTMSSDSATTEVDAPRTHVVVARAAQWLFENLSADSSLQGAEVYQALAQKWQQRTQELLSTPGMRMRTGGASRSGSWSWG